MISVKWILMDCKVLTWTIKGVWTASDYQGAILETSQLCQNSTRDSIVVVDVTQSEAPQDLLKIAKLGWQVAPYSPVKHIILLGPSVTWISLFSIAQRILGPFRLPITFVDTVEEAHKAVMELAQIDQVTCKDFEKLRCVTDKVFA